MNNFPAVPVLAKKTPCDEQRHPARKGCEKVQFLHGVEARESTTYTKPPTANRMSADSSRRQGSLSVRNHIVEVPMTTHPVTPGRTPRPSPNLPSGRFSSMNIFQ